MAERTESSTLHTLYSDRFGEPLTDDEVYGYWLFVAGVILGVVGIGVALVTGSASTTRAIGFVMAGLGLTGTLTGLVLGQSFHRVGKYLVYIGAVVCVLALVWFLAIYPQDWQLGSAEFEETIFVILLYVVGLAIISLSGIVAPVTFGQSRARRAIEDELQAARETARADAAAAQEAIDEERERREAAEVERDRLHDSNATFQLYEDRAEEWRWRLVHQNANIIATSGEGYASDRSARRGMRSVKRNALGADVYWERDETEPEPEPEPVAEDSQATFEVYEDDAGDHRFRLRHDNGEIIAAATRGFSSASGVRESVQTLQNLIGPADYLEFEPAAFELFEDAAGEFRWRLVHRNGQILADSGEGYASRSNGRRAIETVKETIPIAEVGVDSGARFERFEDSAGEHRWRLVSANGEPIADSGEGYTSRSEATNAIERVKTDGADADTLSIGDAAIELYEDSAGEHRWRLRHRNGTILVTGAEGYTSRSGAINGINSVKRNAPAADIEETAD